MAVCLSNLLYFDKKATWMFDMLFINVNAEEIKFKSVLNFIDKKPQMITENYEDIDGRSLDHFIIFSSILFLNKTKFD